MHDRSRKNQELIDENYALKQRIKELEHSETERKRAEEALRDSEERYRNLFDNANEAIYVAQGKKLVFLNPMTANMTGYSAEELLSKPYIGLIHADDRDWVIDRNNRRLKGEKFTDRYSFRIIHKDGNVMWVEANSVLINWNDRPAILAFLSDITERKLAEEALRESEEKYRLIAENTADVISVLDIKSLRYAYISPSVLRYRGFTVEESMEKPLDQMITPESYLIALAAFEEEMKLEASGTADPGRIRTLVLEVYKKDGSTVWVEAHGSFLRDKDQKAIGILSVNRDITERKRMEEALKLSEVTYHEIFNAVNDAIWVHDIGTGEFLDVNNAVTEIFGYSVSEVLNLNVGDISSGVHPFTQETAMELFRAAVDGQPQRFEWQCKHKDGHLFWTEVNLKRASIAGKECVLAIERDITERKLAEEELRKSEKYFRAITENAADVLFIVDVQGMITYCSPSVERILGYRPEDLIGMSGFDLIIPEDQPRAFEDFGKASLTTEVEVPNSFRIRHKNGTVLTMEGIGKNLYHDPVIAGFVMNIRDVTERKRAEEAIRTSEERSRLIAENAKVVIWILDMNLRYTYISPFIKHNLDYTPEEFFVKPLHEVMTPASFELCMQLFADELEEEKKPDRDLSRSRTIEVEQIHRDGRIIPAEINITFIRDAAGDAIGILGITSDITDRKHAEAVLRESERRYRQLIDQAVDGIFVLDHNGDYQLVNKHFCEMLDYSEDELLKLNVIDTYPDELKDIGRQRIQRVISGDSLRFERPMKRKDGAFFQVEMSLSRLDDGRQQGIVHDITERKRIEEELRRLSIAIEQAAEDVMITNPEGVIQYVNPAFEKITGYSRSEAIGQNPRFLKSGAHTPAFYKKLWKTITCGNIWTGRITNRRKDGKFIQEDATISPLLNSAGELTGYVSLKRDITEAVRMEAQLRQAQKMEAIGTLAGGIAHDFNNILGAIMGYTELVKLKTTDINIHSYLVQLLKACGRAKDLVQQILTFSRQREQEKKPVAVTPIVKEAMKLIRSSLPSTVEIRQSYTNRYDTVLADPTQIHQVLMNLCTNAVHAMRKREGVLDVSLRQNEILADDRAYNPELKAGAYLQLIVSDTGEGIDPTIRDKIFDPFYTTKKSGEGTGLGLSVVYGIVKDHGGDITLESKMGVGTTFTVSLPLIDADAEQEGLESAVIPRGKGCILFVDDEEPIASLWHGMLTSLGYEVEVRLSSSDALEAFNAHPERFDLVITDMTMPNMTGAALAREILKIRPELPIIMTTGFSERINKEEAMKIGIREFFMKPVSLTILAQTVKQIMDEEASTH